MDLIVLKVIEGLSIGAEKDHLHFMLDSAKEATKSNIDHTKIAENCQNDSEQIDLNKKELKNLYVSILGDVLNTVFSTL